MPFGTATEPAADRLAMVERFVDASAEAYDRLSRVRGFSQRWAQMQPFERDAVIEGMDAVIPEGSVVVDRARFERLLKCAQVLDDIDTNSEYDPDWRAIREVQRMIQGDLDPLP